MIAGSGKKRRRLREDGSSMDKKKRLHSIILQVAILFLIGVILSGLLTYGSQIAISNTRVKQQTESISSDIAEETMAVMREFPAWEWLIRYWYEHAEELDIEYDVDFGSGTETEEKSRLLSERYPGLQLKYADASDAEAMTAEDRKLFAEVSYSWLITDVNQIKRTHSVSYLFCVMTDESFDTQFFLFSGADAGAVRGTEYEEVYPLGNTVRVSGSQQDAMRDAAQGSAMLADAGDYADYYAYFGEIDGHIVLIGLTYDLSVIKDVARTQTLLGTANAMVYQLCLSLICLALIFLAVLRPLKKVQHSIHLYTETKDSTDVVGKLAAVRTRNEIGRLSEDVAELTREMDDYLCRIETITAEKERIITELSLATRIQADMLPNRFPAFPDRPEFDLYASMIPAREVGGDFYDFFLVDDDHLCMVMADVAGKGIPAALFMMAARIVLKNTAMLGKTPAEILNETNTAICDSNHEEMFVTVWIGILEISTGRLTAANAGHEYPVLKRPDGTYAVLKDRHGFVLGGMAGMKYTQYELQLEPGTRLFLYTDGVPEATDAEGKMFGMERMLAALNKAQNASPEQILKNVRSAVDKFVNSAEQFDDLTMLCMEYRKGEPIR